MLEILYRIMERGEDFNGNKMIAMDCVVCGEEYYDRDNAIEHDNVIYGEYERKLKEKK